MWPWGHLAVAYLAFVLYGRFDSRRQQTALTLIALALGSQFPDLVDKPLAWTFALLQSGRSLGHSLLTLALVGALCFGLAALYRRTDLAWAFSFGWLVHLLTDLGPESVAGLLAGDTTQLQWFTYLVWPLLPLPEPESGASIVGYFLTITLDPYVTIQFALFTVAVAVWVREGTPGLDEVRTLLNPARETV